MAASSTEISNFAIRHLGIGKTVSNIETENSEEAKACNAFFAEARNQCLRDFDWGFARTTKTLSLVGTDPTTEWGYSYTYPTDCLMVRKILSGTRNDTRQSRVSYELQVGTSGTVIYTDEQYAVLQYTKRIEDPVLFPADFTFALSYLLAHFIAPQIGGARNAQMGDKALQNYDVWIQRAWSNAANEGQQDEAVESEFIRGR